MSANGRHETAITFLQTLEDLLEVAQVQLEIYLALLPRAKESALAEKIAILQKRLLTITEVGTVHVLSEWGANLPSALARICGAIRPAYHATFDPVYV